MTSFKKIEIVIVPLKAYKRSSQLPILYFNFIKQMAPKKNNKCLVCKRILLEGENKCCNRDDCLTVAIEKGLVEIGKGPI